MSHERAVANLRHAYMLLMNDHVHHSHGGHVTLAEGLIGPAIRDLEASTPLLRVCRNCSSLAAFEACDEIKTCPTLNIRIHTQEIDSFGCALFEPLVASPSAEPPKP